MKFLVQIEVSLPGDLSEGDRTALLEAELKRGRDLVESGAIRAIWRVPGALRNIGIWEATDATQLHANISSLPLFPWLKAEVTALAEHPLQRFLAD